ncbi:SH3 domain-containing protein [Streptomyces sp. 8L]|uniref:SH3 domain-containing protein n=1 Tax=Streptomyces sp. 8L TaxID=2877242 RepID=UPI001CD6C2BD|nr:SH3 domain-containing protein [Streptomyces sp. 8L]MCA1217357.1 SH3 domain-containing protein [Streptomyces sp. 8L]
MAATSASAAPSCYITASAANVRASASTGAPIVGVAYKNYSCTELTGGKFTGSYWWYHLRITKTGVVGYVREDLVHGSGDVHTCIPEYC